MSLILSNVSAFKRNMTGDHTVSSDMRNILFQEEQRFDQKWLWWLMGATNLVMLPAIVTLFRDEMPLAVKFVIALCCLLPAMLTYMMWKSRLRTQIDSDGIYMEYKPLATRSISWQDVKVAEVVDYGFIGGYGVRKSTKYGTVYNTSGRMGIRLVMKSGKKVLIGTKRPDELRELLGGPEFFDISVRPKELSEE